MNKKIMKALAIALTAACMPWNAACADAGTKGSQGANTAKIPTYTIETSASLGGSITASAASVKEGESVVFTMVGNVGYVLASLTVNGNEMSVSETVSETDDQLIYTYTWIAPAVLSNYKAVAKFVEAEAEVSFVTGEGATVVNNKTVAYGEFYGELATPECEGKRFIGWFDEDGKQITASSIVNKEGEIVLTAKWDEISAEEKAGLKPYSITSTYYDAAATKYGVIWHTSVEPISSVVKVVEAEKGAVVDFENATVTVAETEAWCGEYISKVVIDDLKFGTDYAVCFGDDAAAVWGDTYYFTTREENVTDFSFLYVADSQESPSIENQKEGIYIGDTYWSQVMREATVRFPDAHFIAHGGDMVNYGSEPKYWKEMLGSVEEYLFDMPTIFATGNHEGQWYAASREVTNKIFNVQFDNDELAGDRGYYYSFDYGPMHFVVLRSNDILYGDGKLTAAQIEWLKADLAAANANPDTKWIVAMSHEGPISPSFSKAGSNSHQNTQGPQLMPILTEYNVDLFLYGHEHNLIQTYPVVYDETAAPDNAGVTVRPATNNFTTETDADGNEIVVFKWADGIEKRGTVFHQTGTVGNQWQYGYKLATMESVLARENLRGMYRKILSGGGNCIDAVNRSMYSYLEISESELRVRTYGADARSIVKETDDAALAQHTIYIDGFSIKK